MALAAQQPLLAGVDVVYIAITAVIVFFGIMKQLFEANKGAAGKRAKVPAGPQPPPQRPQPGMQQPMQAGGQQADPLRSQVEEFLRRASRPQADQAGSSPPPSPQRPASDVELVPIESPRPAERRPIGSSSRPAPGRPANPAPAPSEKQQRPQRRQKQRQSVAEHVAERVAAREKNVAEHTSRLGQRIVAEDQQFDDQLNAKFDHAVGTLAGSINPVAQEAAPPPADSPARQIAAMLANPAGVRQAVILNEILQRPSDRW